MAQSSILMSGLFTMGEPQKTFLEMLGLTVPPLLTAQQVQALLARAGEIQSTMDNPMISRMTRENLDVLIAEVAQLQGVPAA
jgi:hypothetical protein